MDEYEHLGKLRDAYINSKNPATLHGDSEVVINGKRYKQSIWQDMDQLIVFQVSKQGFLSSNYSCLRLNFSSNGKPEMLSNEQLWEMGIP
jgi:hypothetical protein